MQVEGPLTRAQAPDAQGGGGGRQGLEPTGGLAVPESGGEAAWGDERGRTAEDNVSCFKGLHARKSLVGGRVQGLVPGQDRGGEAVVGRGDGGMGGVGED